MKTLLPRRLAKQLHRYTEDMTYRDRGFYYPVLDASGPLDESGQPTETVEPVAVDCSFSDTFMQTFTESWKGSVDILHIDAEVRFAGVVPTKGGKFLITERFGDIDFEDQLYEIIAIADRGEFGYRCALRRLVL